MRRSCRAERYWTSVGSGGARSSPPAIAATLATHSGALEIAPISKCFALKRRSLKFVYISLRVRHNGPLCEHCLLAADMYSKRVQRRSTKVWIFLVSIDRSPLSPQARPNVLERQRFFQLPIKCGPNGTSLLWALYWSALNRTLLHRMDDEYIRPPTATKVEMLERHLKR